MRSIQFFPKVKIRNVTCYDTPIRFYARIWTFHGVFKNKDAAPKSSVTGGVNTFPNKKGLVRSMAMNQNALDTSDIGEHFTYSQRDEKMRQKIFRAVWKKFYPKIQSKSRNFPWSPTHILGYDFLKSDKKCFLLSYNYFNESYDTLSYTKR